MWLCRGRQAFTDICKGLFMLHSNQICHLDMKTPNVLIGNDGTCKIADLGLGRMMDTKASMVSMAEMATLVYMAPEHIQGQAGLASDIWSLSIILWEVSSFQIIFPAPKRMHRSLTTRGLFLFGSWYRNQLPGCLTPCARRLSFHPVSSLLQLGEEPDDCFPSLKIAKLPRS